MRWRVRRNEQERFPPNKRKRNTISDPSIPDRVRTGPDLLERIREVTPTHQLCVNHGWRALLYACADELDRERQHVAALEEALRPLAEYIAASDAVADKANIPRRHEDLSIVIYGSCDGVKITVADCRRAAALLAEATDGR